MKFPAVLHAIGISICISMMSGCGDGGGGNVITSDSTPPAVVTDLVASPSGTQSVDLFWTAVGDDGLSGTATSYDVRFHTNAGARWETMTQAAGEPIPEAAGSAESMQILGLENGRTYFFRIRVSDEEGNSSGISNVASATTLGEADLGWVAGFAPEPFGQGIEGTVLALAEFGGDLIAGGSFVSAGGTRVSNVARWDGSRWHPLGEGANGAVRALIVHGGVLYAGGDFTSAGGIRAASVARWDGNAWSRVAGDLDGPVTSLAVYEGDLVAGGGFAHGGDVPLAGIGRVDGVSWRPLGSGVDDWVQALVPYGPDLFAAGYFTHAGGVPAVYVARWDGAEWHPLGAGREVEGGAVFALAAHDGFLYAGGRFTEMGLIETAYLARWDGSAWSALDERIQGGDVEDPAVFALGVFRGDLIAAGRFELAGRCEVNHVVGFQGDGCRPLGSGLGGSVAPIGRALAITGDALAVGGAFETAGNRLSGSIAFWSPAGGSPATPPIHRE